jgi:ATP-dependent Lhr-like helicase
MPASKAPSSALDAFHPTIRRWFSETLGEPTKAQARAWPRIASGANTLLAAPTGSGKTLAAFLWVLNQLLVEGDQLTDETRILYVSPLKALANDIQKNLLGPLAELRAMDPRLADLRVFVRSGDTPQHQRTAMTKRPPHILVTTPESLYILLTSDGGRSMLSNVRQLIVDEIHALTPNKRGAHLALSMERLEELCGPVQRIGLSATQKPLSEVAEFLVGPGRQCEMIDEGHLRQLDVDLELPQSPLEAVCSHETWEDVYRRMTELIAEHRTTIVFVNTRKMAERVAARLSEHVGEEFVGCHHGSLSKERRLLAEQRLKAGQLRALVATASLELGIDIGDVDLVIQCGSTRSIATFLQRVGRSGHGVGRVPKGRVFPLTQDELAEAMALLRAAAAGKLDRTLQPGKPLDILAQQIVAACVAESWEEDALYAWIRRSKPYADLSREEFESVLELHSQDRLALLHRDGVHGRVRGTRRARMVAITGGGAIADLADYRVLEEPSGSFVGTVNEDFAIESSAGDIFQLGNSSWQVLKVEQGVLRVADAHGAPPNLPFWLGEAPARSEELAAELSELRAAAAHEDFAIDTEAARQLADYVREGVRVLGCVPTQRRVILERFFDESGGMQLVLHAPFGGRINRAWGFALRKKFCRGFGFELQAAANEEAIVLSLGPQHSFPLAEVFDYLHPDRAREDLIQAILPTPFFAARWRWNVTRALLVPRMQGGRKLPAPLARMRADDLLVKAFPAVVACGETLPPGDIPVPMDHPLVRQTIEDVLHEAMDVDGFLRILGELRAGRIETRCVDTPEPSAFCRGILNAAPYAFLDDAPLEERRTQAVAQRRILDRERADDLGALDPAAVARVREEAWPDPRDREELHEALLWMGYAGRDEILRDWMEWLVELMEQGRAQLAGDRYFATEASRDPAEVWRGRLSVCGPVSSDDPTLGQLEAEGAILRVRFEGQQQWCDRRLLARIHRYTLDALRREIEPVSASVFLRFLARWQHVHPESQLSGPDGVRKVLEQLSGFQAPASSWERVILPARVRGYRPDMLDGLCWSGEIAWGRLWGSGGGAARSTPIALMPRLELRRWMRSMEREDEASLESQLSGRARPIHDLLRRRGALFFDDILEALGILPEHAEMGLAKLVGAGLISCDSFGGLRQLFYHKRHRRRGPPRRTPRVATTIGSGRWSLLGGLPSGENGTLAAEDGAEEIARALLQRWGVVFRQLLDRERLPMPWRQIWRACRRLELRGEVRGGRFVARFAGEHFALPEAVDELRRQRRNGMEDEIVEVSASDPLNLTGILTPDARVASGRHEKVRVG